MTDTAKPTNALQFNPYGTIQTAVNVRKTARCATDISIFLSGTTSAVWP